MKINKIIKIIILTIICLLLSMNFSYAAIEIKDTTQSVLTNKTISDFYDMAEEMKNAGQGLEGTNVDVKMANNYEWAVVSYFSNSSYGTGGAGGNTGASFTTPVKEHKSTNGNITGVMDWGRTYTFTAGIIASYASKTFSDTVSGNGARIIANAGTNKIDKFKASDSKIDYAIAKTGWYSPSWNYAAADERYPYSLRTGLFRLHWR